MLTNPYKIILVLLSIEVPPDDTTGVKWLEMSNIVCVQWLEKSSNVYHRPIAAFSA